MGRNWDKARRRDLVNATRQRDIDDSRYLNELYAVTHEPREGRKSRIATLKCKCGHKGLINTTPGQRFRCSKCGQRYWT